MNNLQLSQPLKRITLALENLADIKRQEDRYEDISTYLIRIAEATEKLAGGEHKEKRENIG